MARSSDSARPSWWIGSPFSVGSPDRVASKHSSEIGSRTTPAIVPLESSTAMLTAKAGIR